MALTLKQFLSELESRLKEEGVTAQDDITEENTEKIRDEVDGLCTDVESGDWSEGDDDDTSGEDTEG